MKKLIILFLLFNYTGLRVNAQDLKIISVDEMEEYREILEEARSNSKMLLVALVDDNDQYWKAMRKEGIFSNPAVKAVLGNYSIVEIEISSAMGIDWIQLFPVESLPAFYFLNNDEILLELLIGQQSDTALIETAKEATAKKDSYKTLSTKYSERTLTAMEWADLLEIHAMNFQYYESQALAKEYLNSLKNDQLLAKENLKILLKYGTDLETKYPGFIIKNKNNIQNKLPEYEFADFFTTVYSYNLDRAVISKDSVLLKNLVQNFIPANPDTSVNNDELIFETRKLYAEETGQFNIWANAALEYYSALSNDSLRAEAFFEEGFWLADNFNSLTAKKAARKLANEAVKINKLFRYLMLEGYMAYLMKDYENAERLVKEASNINDHPNNKRKAEGLLRMIEAAKKD